MKIVLLIDYSKGRKHEISKQVRIDLMDLLNETDREILKRPLVSRSSVWSKVPAETIQKHLGLREPQEMEEDHLSSLETERGACGYSNRS